MDSEIQPQGIPQEILKNKKAIDLYKWGIWFIGGILSAIVVGTIVLTFFGQQVPDLLGNIGVLLAVRQRGQYENNRYSTKQRGFSVRI